jgi:tetratricopeptide (TPR) repeat protein
MPESATVALLFTDLVNSTVHLRQAGDDAGQHLFRAHHKLPADAIGTCGGEELQWLGDGVLAAFSSSADAVRCAIQIQQTAGSRASTMLFLAGDLRRSLAMWQQEAADAERRGRVGWAVTAWADLASAHIALGDFAAGLAACDRSSALEARATGSASDSTNMDLMSARHELRIALDEGWEQVIEDVATNSLIEDPSLEDHWAFAMVRACAAYVFARLHQPELSLQWLSSIPAAVERGAYWEHTYCGTVCDGAAALWLLNRNDYSEVFERNLRLKVLPHDFRYPTRDSRLSLARLCALNNRYEEASDWFAKAREVLDEQGARPLRAIADYDEALMFVRRSAPGDMARARPFLDAASQQFQTLGMSGWIRRAEEATL